MDAATNPGAGAGAFAPGGIVRGEVVVGPSKSIAQRALICAALARGTTRLDGFAVEAGDDIAAARAFAAWWGARIARLPRVEDALELAGVRTPAGRGTLALGESGTLARFAVALLATSGARGEAWRTTVGGSLRRRASEPLLAALRAAGARLTPLDAPLELLIEPVVAPRTIELQRPQSSQEVSALLIALAAAGGERELRVQGEIPSRPYVELTIAVLRAFGAHVVEREDSRFTVCGPLVAPPHALRVEADASSAAVALAAGCLSGGACSVRGLGPDSPQPDRRAIEVLRAFGCAARAHADAASARGFPLHGADLDLAATPDLAPVAAALAAAVAVDARRGRRSAEAVSVLRGLATLARKESARVEVLARGFTALGLEVTASADSLRIAPGRGALPRGATLLATAGDHRMAFAFALVSLVVPGIRLDDVACVNKSWPGFWEELERAGARRSRRDEAVATFRR